MRTVRACAVLAAVLVLPLAACGDEEAAATPVPVELAGSKKVAEITLGLVVSKASPAGQGADWAAAAAGAEVAAYRYRNGATDVSLEVVDDQGTDAGATAAVETLVDAGVSGIVVATSGSHVRAAIDEASTAGIPVLAPYYRDAADLPDGAWVTGVTDGDLETSMSEALAEVDRSKPFVVTGDGVSAPGVTPVDSASATKDDDLTPLIKDIAAGVSSGAVDSVVVAASALTQAAVVREVQGSAALDDVPLLLTPEATSPEFGRELVRLGGTVSRSLVTIGPAASDVAALGTDDRAERAGAFFAADRLAAADPTYMSDVQAVEAPFSNLAGVAAIPAQDAVVALVAAAIEAGSADAAKIAARLPKLALDSADGLAGPALDFGSAHALDPDEVVVLRSTGQNPGVRPDATGRDKGDGTTEAPFVTTVFWFPVPAGETEG